MKAARRTFLIGAGATLVPLSAERALAAAFHAIPQKPSARVIIDNDFAGDPDGLLALAHQLLSPKTVVPLVTSSALNSKFVEAKLAGRSAIAGKNLAEDLIRRLALKTKITLAAGSETATLQSTEAARAIVAEAMRDDKMPLFLTCGGPLTNVAAALKLEPAIASRMTLIWIGGGAYPAGGWEYNLATDVEAARLVIEQSTVPLWQIPQNAYRQLQYSIAEMAADMRPISPFARWLYERFTSPPDFFELGGTWPMGDSPLILLTALTSESSRYTDRLARRITTDDGYGNEIANRPIRVFEQIDTRLVMADFLAQLRLHAKR